MNNLSNQKFRFPKLDEMDEVFEGYLDEIVARASSDIKKREIKGKISHYLYKIGIDLDHDLGRMVERPHLNNWCNLLITNIGLYKDFYHAYQSLSPSDKLETKVDVNLLIEDVINEIEEIHNNPKSYEKEDNLRDIKDKITNRLKSKRSSKSEPEKETEEDYVGELKEF